MTASLRPTCGALRQKLNNVVLALGHLVWGYIGQVSWRSFCFERVFGRDETCCRHRQVSGLERQWGSLGKLKTQIKAGCTSTGCTVYIVQALAYKSLYFFLCHCVKGFIPFIFINLSHQLTYVLSYKHRDMYSELPVSTYLHAVTFLVQLLKFLDSNRGTQFYF